MVVAALVVIVVESGMAFSVSRPSHPSAAGILTPVTSLVAPSGVSALSNYEGLGGCVEDAHDHNHDVDPRGFIDQEDDECLPAQSAHRQPDGAPAN